jgi:hypothetical protein
MVQVNRPIVASYNTFNRMAPASTLDGQPELYYIEDFSLQHNFY